MPGLKHKQESTCANTMGGCNDFLSGALDSVGLQT